MTSQCVGSEGHFEPGPERPGGGAPLQRDGSEGCPVELTGRGQGIGRCPCGQCIMREGLVGFSFT